MLKLQSAVDELKICTSTLIPHKLKKFNKNFTQQKEQDIQTE